MEQEGGEGSRCETLHVQGLNVQKVGHGIGGLAVGWVLENGMIRISQCGVLFGYGERFVTNQD